MSRTQPSLKASVLIALIAVVAYGVARLDGAHGAGVPPRGGLVLPLLQPNITSQTWPLEPRTYETSLNFAHILVAHRDATFSAQSFWLPGPVPTRSREEARSLAIDYRARALLDPSGFGLLALQLSDDVASRRVEGLLGAQPVMELPEPFQPALLGLAVGEISDVVESPAGFHILRREPRYPRTRLAASRIVIHYEGATKLPGFRERPILRAEALRLAEQAHDTLTGGTTSFDNLAREVSDAPDAVQGGDLGVHETAADASASPALWSAVSALEIGQISPVLDTPIGWQILMRTSDALRLTLWAEEILVSHRDSSHLLPGLVLPARSQQEAKAVARQIHTDLLANPDRFVALREEFCEVERCLAPLEPWADGRGTPGFDAVLTAIGIGEIAPTVLETTHGFHIVRRLAPESHVPTKGMPADIRLVRTVASLEGSAPPALEPLLERLRAFRGHVLSNLDLQGEPAKQFEGAFDEFSGRLAGGEGAQVISMMRKSNATIRSALGPERFTRYRQYRQAWSERTP